MPRVTVSVSSRRRRRKIIKQAKGYWGKRKNVYKIAKNAVEKALEYQYRDRKTRKRMFKRLWILRINAAARLHGTNYSQLMCALKKNNVVIDRKLLAHMAVDDPDGFSSIVQKVMNK